MRETGAIITLWIVFLFIKFMGQVLWYEIGPKPGQNILSNDKKKQLPSENITDGELFWYDREPGNLF